MQTTITTQFLQDIKSRIQRGDKDIRTELRKELVAAGYNNQEVSAIFSHPIVAGTRYGTALRIVFEDGFVPNEDQNETDDSDEEVNEDVTGPESEETPEVKDLKDMWAN